MTGAHGMRGHNGNKATDHVQHSILSPLNHILLVMHKFSSITGSVSLVASVAKGDNVCMVVLLDC